METVEEIATPLDSDGGSRQFRDIPWSTGDTLIGLAPLLVHRGLSAYFGPVHVSWRPFLLMFWVPLSILPFAWMVGCPLWLAYRRGYAGPKLPKARGVLVQVGFALSIFPAALALNNMVLSVFSAASCRPASSGLPFGPIYRSSSFNALVITLLAVAVAPVAEEVFFRGLVYNFLRRRLPLAFAIVIQAVAFAAMHPYELQPMSMIFVTGCVLGGVYEWRQTLVAPMAYHALQNLVASMVLFFFAAIVPIGPDPRAEGIPHRDDRRNVRVTSPDPPACIGLKVSDTIRPSRPSPSSDRGS